MARITVLFFLIQLFVLFTFVAAGQVREDRWAKYDAGKVHYYDIGPRNKKALIFIHGWTCNADFWRDSLNAFPNYRVIALDLPGHGKSDKPHATYSMEYFARSVEAVMKDAKVKQAVVVGHSMGTPIARQFYRLFPDKTLGIVVVDGPLKPFGPKDQMDKFFGPLLTNYKDEEPKFVDGLLKTVRSDLKPYIRETMTSAPDYVGASAMKGMLDESIWTDDQINVPVLAIMAKGPLFQGNIEETYKSIAPKLEFHMWTDVSHFLMMEKPPEFNEAVRSFVVKNKLL